MNAILNTNKYCKVKNDFRRVKRVKEASLLSYILPVEGPVKMSEPARDDAPAGRLNLKSNRNDVPNGTYFLALNRTPEKKI